MAQEPTDQVSTKAATHSSLRQGRGRQRDRTQLEENTSVAIRTKQPAEHHGDSTEKTICSSFLTSMFGLFLKHSNNYIGKLNRHAAGHAVTLSGGAAVWPPG